MEEEQVNRIPDLQIPPLVFLLSSPYETNKEQVKSQLLQHIREKNMLPYYLFLCEQFKWDVDTALVATMKEENETKLKEIEDKIEDAVKNLGENEIREGLLQKAEFFARVGEKEKALSAYRQTSEKTVALGQRLDIVFTLIRLGFFWNDQDLLIKNIDKAKTLVEEGGDWDRRNRLKVYEGLYSVSHQRWFGKAAELFLETLSTFTSYELFDYNTFIFYTVLTSIVSLDRVLLKNKVIDAPEILAVIRQIPYLSDFLNSLYESNYKLFFKSLVEITDRIKKDNYLSRHWRYFSREMRVIAYSQLLKSYRSVQLHSMADAFGVSVPFLDKELSLFISSGRLHCKIDKVGGIVETNLVVNTNRPDAKNALYQATIKQGDVLLNRIQKMARVIDL